jgi:hypothetical protein
VQEGWEFVAGSEEEDDADDKAVGGGEGRDERLDARAVGAGDEDAGGAGGHESVHEEEADDEAEKAEEASAGASEVGGQEEEEELRWGFGAEAVDDAYGEDGGAVVAEGERGGLWGDGIGEAADAPLGVACSGDEQGDAAAGSGVVVMVSRFAVEEGDEDVDAESDESCSDKSLADGVHVLGEADVEEDDGGSEDGDGEGVAECVEEAPGALDGGDVGDSGEVVVVEAVTEAEEGAGEESEFEARRHVFW